jgi:hypothetical protein
MARKRDLTHRGTEKLSARERNVGLDTNDEAARWLDEHDPAPPPAVPKRASKNKALHRWNRRSE